MNNQAVMGQFYNRHHNQFVTYFKTKYGKTEEYLSDLYIEAYEALWNNIHIGRLTEEKLKGSMYGYLFGIADNMLKANDRKTRELFRVNMFYKDAEDLDESLDVRVQDKIKAEADQEESLARQSDLQDFVDRAVAEMQPPCNELLRNFYWNKLSGEEIAEKMGYKTPDSVKTQKNKCMNKLKPIVKQYAKL